MCPRKRRTAPSGATLHIVNRGVDRRQIFFEPFDYQYFLTLLAKAKTRSPVRVFGYALMPNHFHLVAQAAEDKAISAYMKWVSGCYACELRALTRTRGNGHVFQQRYWSDVVDSDLDFLRLMRYVEANPMRAKLVARAESWPWSSLYARHEGGSGILDDWPVSLPDNWTDIVNASQPAEELAKIRAVQQRGRPPRT